MIGTAFILTLAAAGVASSKEGQLTLPFTSQGIAMRPLAGIVTVLLTDGRLVDLDDEGAIHPSARRLKKWRHVWLLMGEGVEQIFDSDHLDSLAMNERVLVLNNGERGAVESILR